MNPYRYRGNVKPCHEHHFCYIYRSVQNLCTSSVPMFFHDRSLQQGQSSSRLDPLTYSPYFRWMRGVPRVQRINIKLSKHAQSIDSLGYAYRPSFFRGPDETPLWEVIPKSGVDYIALLGYDTKKGIVTIYEAWTRNGHGSKSLKLRDIIVSFWKHKAGQNISTLRVIRYWTVLEETMRPLIRDIYDKMNLGSNIPLILPARGMNIGERNAYLALLHQGPFGNGAQKMLAEYAEFSGRNIEAFEIQDTGYPDDCCGFHHLLIYID